MNTRSLGTSGLQITTVGFGSWAVGGGGWAFGWGPQDDAESEAAIVHAVERGVNWVDTAAAYGLGHSEEVIGRAVAAIAPAERPFIFTKCGVIGDPANPMAPTRRMLRPESIRRECDASLRRLGVERIDLYQFHWPDETGVPVEDSWGEMARLADVHVVELLEEPAQERDNLELRRICASAEWLVRPSGLPKDFGSLRPRAVREFANDDLDWLIHRQLYCREIDVLQLEYTPLAQYWGDYRRIVTALFEHDIYFQSIRRGLGHMIGPVDEVKARFEYLRALRFELGALPAFDQVQVCTPANRDHLLSFLPRLASRLRAGLRAGIVTSRYQFRTEAASH